MSGYFPRGKRTFPHLACCLSLLFLLFLFLLLTPAGIPPGGQYANEALAVEGKNLAGPAFIDQTSPVQMGPGWEERPILYEKWARDADLTVSLDQHLYLPLLPAIERYGRERGIKIAVQEGTCGVSGGLLAGKAVDVVGLCCPPGPADRLPGLRFHTLGIVALAILVHPDNPVTGVTFHEAQQIFRGRIYSWSELKDSSGKGGPGFPIRTVARLHCKLMPGQWRLLLDRDKLFSPRLLEVGAIQDVIRRVYADPFAIGGFETLYMADHQYRPERKLRALEIEGFSPANPDHLASGSYPLYFTLSVTTWTGAADQNPHAGALVDYLMKSFENTDPRFGLVPVSRLRKAGWQFRGDELIGSPAGPIPDSR